MEGHDRADGEKMGGRDKWLGRTKETAGGKRSRNKNGDGEGHFPTFPLVNDYMGQICANRIYKNKNEASLDHVSRSLSKTVLLHTYIDHS